jgi:group I intron endonuclease
MIKITAIYFMESPSGRIYIGQTRNLKGRIAKYKGAHCKGQPKLGNSIKKHGFDNHNFRVLQYLPDDISQNELNNLEIFCIDQFREAGYDMLNLKDGGSKGGLNPKSIERMRKKLKKTINKPRYKKRVSKLRKGKKISDYQKERLAYGRSKRVYKPITQEHKEKMRIAFTKARTGIPRSDETKKRISEAQKGRPRKPMTKEQIEKIRIKSTGRKMPDYAKQQIRSAREIAVVQYNLNGAKVKTWRSAKVACETLGLCRGHFCNQMKAGKPYKGFMFKKISKQELADRRTIYKNRLKKSA